MCCREPLTDLVVCLFGLIGAFLGIYWEIQVVYQLVCSLHNQLVCVCFSEPVL